MTGMKVYGMENLLNEVKAELVDKSDRGNELYLVRDLFPTNLNAYFLKYNCPSTDRVYISGIDPDYAKNHEYADSCMAWKYGLSDEEYSLLKVES